MINSHIFFGVDLIETFHDDFCFYCSLFIHVFSTRQVSSVAMNEEVHYFRLRRSPGAVLFEGSNRHVVVNLHTVAVYEVPALVNILQVKLADVVSVALTTVSQGQVEMQLAVAPSTASVSAHNQQHQNSFQKNDEPNVLAALAQEANVSCVLSLTVPDANELVHLIQQRSQAVLDAIEAFRIHKQQEERNAQLNEKKADDALMSMTPPQESVSASNVFRGNVSYNVSARTSPPQRSVSPGGGLRASFVNEETKHLEDEDDGNSSGIDAFPSMAVSAAITGTSFLASAESLAKTPPVNHVQIASAFDRLSPCVAPLDGRSDVHLAVLTPRAERIDAVCSSCDPNSAPIVGFQLPASHPGGSTSPDSIRFPSLAHTLPPPPTSSSLLKPSRDDILRDYKHSTEAAFKSELTAALEQQREAARSRRAASEEAKKNHLACELSASHIGAPSDATECVLPADSTVASAAPVVSGSVSALTPEFAAEDAEIIQRIDSELHSRSTFWRSREGKGVLFLLASNSKRITRALIVGDDTKAEHYNFDDGLLTISLSSSTSLAELLNSLAHNTTVYEVSLQSLPQVSDAFVYQLCEQEMEKAELSCLSAIQFCECMSLTDASAEAILEWMSFVRGESASAMKGSLRHVTMRGTRCPWSCEMYQAVMRSCTEAMTLHAVQGFL